MVGVLGGFDRLMAGVEFVERVLVALIVALFSGLIIVNVILRYVFNSPLYYAEEVSVILLIWMAFLASSLAIGSRQMVAVTMFQDVLPPPLRRYLMPLVQAVGLGISGLMLYWSTVWIQAPSAGREIILTLGLPKWPSLIVVPIFFALAALKFFWLLTQDLRGHKP